MTGRKGGPIRRRPRVWRRALFLFLLPAILAAAGCGRMPRIIVLTDPLTAEEHLALGVAYERNGEFDLAIREYERALRKEKDFFQARVNLGNARLAKKEYGKAEEEYRKALEVRPGDPEATNNLAWAAIFTGERMEEAAARMEAVLSRPENGTPTLFDTLGVLRKRLGRTAAADEAFAEAEALCLGERGCPAETLREIRDHREERDGRVPSPAAPSLVQ
ncbi:MAG: tetratricopeptide repeat protein [Candidatus Deferrimicrobiaceae bacterium]